MNKLLTHLLFLMLMCVSFIVSVSAQGGKRVEPPKPLPKHRSSHNKVSPSGDSKKPAAPEPNVGQPASFTLTVIPHGSAVFLNDQQVEGPTIAGLLPGSYVLKVSHEGYQENLRSITLMVGENSPVTVILEPIQGTLNVLPNIPGATIVVQKAGSNETVDDHYAGEVANLKLTPGDYQVTVYKEGYKKIIRKITLQASGSVYLEPQLEPLPAGAPPTVAAAETAEQTSSIAGEQYEPAVAMKKVAPAYSSAARAANVTGIVMVSVQIDDQGRVRSVKAVEGPSWLRQAAEHAAKQWKFKPARKNGQPVEETQLIKFMFQR